MMQKKLLNNFLDSTVVPGFSRIGYEVRSRLEKWDDVASMDLSGRVIIITGPTSGLGAATARLLASTGAQLVLVGRNRDKCLSIASELSQTNRSCDPVVVIAEMGDLSSVARASAEIGQLFPRIDVLVHNAGALLQDRTLSVQGIEQTIASHVLGPHLMTTLLRNALRAAHGRVVTVSSGGMYAAPLPSATDANYLEMSESSYNGTRQYAIAKRAQVTLTEIWAREEPEVEFVSMHPGWADTPGVKESIPLFRTLTKPILRNAVQGADTIAWLCAVHPLPGNNGTFWSDRRVRAIHKIPQTRRSDTSQARTALWQWCNDKVHPFVQ